MSIKGILVTVKTGSSQNCIASIAVMISVLEMRQ